MTKGKFGIRLSFYAVVAFVLAVLGQTLLCGALLGFVIVTEKNEWLTRQAMQAFFLTLIYPVVNTVLNALNVFTRWPFNEIPYIGNVFSRVFGLLGTAVSIIVLILALIAILKVMKGQEASLPLLSTWANKALGILEQKVYTQMPPQQQMPPQNPQGNQFPPQQMPPQQ